MRSASAVVVFGDGFGPGPLLAHVTGGGPLLRVLFGHEAYSFDRYRLGLDGRPLLLLFGDTY